MFKCDVRPSFFKTCRPCIELANSCGQTSDCSSCAATARDAILLSAVPSDGYPKVGQAMVIIDGKLVQVSADQVRNITVVS